MIMRVVAWLLLLMVTFFIALVLVLTFMQPAFKQEVGARILTIHTRSIPVYMYVLGAFTFGLFLGVLGMLAGYVSAKRDAFRKNRRIRELELQCTDSPAAGRPGQSGEEQFLPAETEELP